MNVSLTPRLERFVNAQVESGRFQSASEVVREALRLFEEKEHARQLTLKELGKKIASGLDQLERGQVFDGHQVFRELAGRSRRRRGAAK